LAVEVDLMTQAPLLAIPLVERLLAAAMERGAEFAEVYVERSENTAVTLDEHKVKSAQSGLSLGVGLRVIAGAKVGYAYSDDLDDEALFRAARTAAFIAHGGGSEQAFTVNRTPLPTFYRLAQHLSGVEVEAKRELIVRANKAAHAYDKRIKQVMASYADTTKRILVANTQGHLAEDTQDLCRINVHAVAEGAKGERRTGSFGGGGRVPFSHFDTFTPEHVAREASGRRRRPPASRRSSSRRAGAAFCSTRPSAMASRPTSFARARRCSPESWARRSPRSSSPSSTTARWRTRAAR
jgi:TldD protein